MSGSSARGLRGSGVALACLAAAAVFALATGARAEGLALKLRATATAASASVAPFTIELFRWSTDAERAPLVAALSAPRPAPAAAAPAGRAAGGRAAGRGGRGAAPPQSPAARLTSATKAAPTVGFLWGDGATGYSVKYAWHSTTPDGRERVVLLTDRRIGANAAPSSEQPAGAAPDVEFTVIDLRLDAKGGEGKLSNTGAVVVDAAAATLALDGYAAAPALLKVTR